MTPPTFSNLGASANPDINNGADLSSYANSSWTPPTSGLIIVGVWSRNAAGPNEPTISGNGLTWVSIATVVVTTVHRLTIFGANASGSSAGVTTIDFGGQTQIGCTALFGFADDADLSGGVAAAFVQAVSNSGTNIQSLEITLAAASHADNRPFAVFSHAANEVTDHRTNWTELDDLAGVGPTRGIASQYRGDSFETTASASWASAVTGFGIAVEIKGASSGVTGTASITQADNTVVAAGVLPLASVLNQTQAGDTLSAAGTLPIVGVMNVTQAGDSLSATGVLPITSIVSITQDGNSVASTGVITITGVVSKTQDDNVLSATGELPIVGTLEVAQDDNTLVATGAGEASTNGEASLTQADNILSATSALQIAGVLSVTQGDNSISSVGLVLIKGGLSQTQDDNTMVATGNLAAEIEGVLSQTQANNTLLATGALAIKGVLAITQDGNTLVATNIEVLEAHYIYVIPVESRVFVIPFAPVETSEDRELSILAEDRIAEVEHA